MECTVHPMYDPTCKWSHTYNILLNGLVGKSRRNHGISNVFSHEIWDFAVHIPYSPCCPEGALGAALHRADLAGHVPHSAASWLLTQLEFQQFWFYLMDFDGI